MPELITDGPLIDKYVAQASSGRYFDSAVVENTASQRGDTASVAVFKRALTGFFGQILEALTPRRNLSLLVTPQQVGGELDIRTGYHEIRGLGDPAPLRGTGSSVPRVAIVGEETLLDVETFALAAAWTWLERESAELASRQGLAVRVDTTQIAQMGKAFARKANDLGFFGDDDLRIQGIFNNTNIKQYGFVDSAGVAVQLNSNSSNQQIREAFGILIDKAEIETDGSLRTNVVGICKTGYSYLKNTQNSDSSDVSLISWLRNTNSGVQFLDINELSKGYQDRLFGTTGRISDDYVIALDTTMDGWIQSMPLSFMMLTLREENLFGWVLPGLQRIGGVHCPYPAGVAIAKNVLGQRTVTGS